MMRPYIRTDVINVAAVHVLCISIRHDRWNTDPRAKPSLTDLATGGADQKSSILAVTEVPKRAKDADKITKRA